MNAQQTPTDRYAAILVAVLDLAKEIGQEDGHADAAEACYRLLEEAKTQADAWDVPLREIGLEGVEPANLFRQAA